MAGAGKSLSSLAHAPPTPPLPPPASGSAGTGEETRVTSELPEQGTGSAVGRLDDRVIG